MRPFSIAVCFALLATAFASAGCDQLNKPLSTSSSSSSSSSSGGSAATSADGGDATSEAGAPAPAITAQPGDIQL